METITLNIGGVLFETTYATLKTVPNSRLGDINTSAPEFNNTKKHFFFDRNPEVFNCVLDLYRTGTLHMPHNICGAVFRKELEFWKIGPEALEECCLERFYKYENDKKVFKLLKQSFADDIIEEEYKYDSGTNVQRWKKWKRKIWFFFDKPSSSKSAKVFSYVYLLCVLLSCIVFCLQTHEGFRVPISHELGFNLTDIHTHFETHFDMNNPKHVLFVTTKSHEALIRIHDACLIFFTLELILHFASSPNRVKFFKSPINSMETAIIFIMWVVFAFEKNLEKLYHSGNSAIELYRYIKAAAILRLFRLFRLVKRSRGMNILFLSLISSLRELLMMFGAFLLMVALFAALMFYAEFNEPSTFPNIFPCMWWSVVTMTTVGYGDSYPKSTAGYIVGSSCAICGVLILTLPIAVVATRFSEFYERNSEIETHKNVTERRAAGKNSLDIVKVRPIETKSVW